jgi:hypothetical protein
MLVCKHCQQSKETTDFPKAKRTRSGLSPWCKACHVEATRVWRERKRIETEALRQVGREIAGRQIREMTRQGVTHGRRLASK